MADILEHDISTNTITFRDYTAEEALERNATKVAYNIEEAVLTTKLAEIEAAKKIATAKLAALGLTTDDLKALGL